VGERTTVQCPAVRTWLIFTVLMVAKTFSRIFYLHRLRWVEPVPEQPWNDLRLVVLLNHTSLFEWLFVGSVPNSFLWRTARHGVIPAAEKTLYRPLVGRFFKLLGQHVIPITRRADETWQQVLNRVDAEGMVIILPEGRMKRATGLDIDGRPMTVKGGVADILEATPTGRMLYAYSAGLHHIQVPGQKLPKPFRRLELTVETLDIPEYRAEIEANRNGQSFKQTMKNDMERRKALWARSFSRRANETRQPN